MHAGSDVRTTRSAAAHSASTAWALRCIPAVRARASPSKLPCDDSRVEVLSSRILLRPADLCLSRRFYRDVLGFETKPGAAFATDKTIASLIDATGARWRINSARVPGTAIEWELIEFKDITRKPFQLAVPDAGSPAVSVVVKDMPSALDAVKAGGGTVVTVGGKPIPLGKTSLVFVRDPNGFLIELMQGSAQ